MSNFHLSVKFVRYRYVKFRQEYALRQILKQSERLQLSSSNIFS